jgi:multidrug efflux pump subunit AcrA (membrane-fusion protein)
VSLERLRVVADIPQNDIEAVRREKMARVWLPQSMPVERRAGDITFFAYADPATSTFKVRVSLPEGVTGLYPGMYLKTDFKIGTRDVLSVPLSAVVHRASMTGVYVAGEGMPVLRQVRLGPELDGQRVEVLAGLVAGEDVYLDPAEAIALRQGVRGHE